MSADIAVRSRCDKDEDDEDDYEACFAEAGLPTGPVDEPDERERCRRCENCAGRTDGRDLELGARPSAVRGVGERRSPYARLLAQQLRGDYEVPKVLEKSFVVGAPKAGVDRFLETN